MYKWFVIIPTVLLTLITIALQTELWPFSNYPMFSNHYLNRPKNSGQGFKLWGLTSDRKEVLIQDKRILGAVHPGILSLKVESCLSGNNTECIPELMNYWRRRYIYFKPRLPENLTEFEKLILKNSTPNDKTTYFELPVSEND